MRYTVPAAGTLGDCLARLLREASGRTRKQLLAGDRVRVNGVPVRRADTQVGPGDVVELTGKQPRDVRPAGIRIVHEDDDLLVVDKPHGVLTIATERERERTLYAHLTARARGAGRVFIVHRLDRLASGLLVFAKTVAAKRMLQAQLAAHTVERRYLAVVEGAVVRRAGTIASRLVDDEPGRVRRTRDPAHGRPAVTHWRVESVGARYTLLEVRLETGRRNQIRVHLAGEGHPIAGDRAYGAATNPFRRLALHAQVLGFDHPRTGARLRFVSPAPSSFAKLAR